MTKILSLFLLGITSSAALAQHSPIGNESPADEQAPEKAAGDTAAADAEEYEPFVPPPGFKTKKRGELVLYCIKDSTVGTRFKTEKCFSEDQVRDYLIAQQENKRDMDRIRSTCANASVCAQQ